ncbi:MAG TPA: hypothetical protein P5534_03280 [Candidatus Paceibacterota bacterium]|nr:hypothetical protein [Candidatus Paceibacterota bacterium]HRZ57471.1 hypothetical protein [Candidatus Paceibacterota bacterium]
MVTRSSTRRTALARRGALMTELIVALSIVIFTIFPLALAFLNEQKLCRAYYYRALALEIVDGEMEVLAAGEWRAFETGVHAYQPLAPAATNLPPGRFELTVSDGAVRLVWQPGRRDTGGRVVREVKVR